MYLILLTKCKYLICTWRFKISTQKVISKKLLKLPLTHTTLCRRISFIYCLRVNTRKHWKTYFLENVKTRDLKLGRCQKFALFTKYLLYWGCCFLTSLQSGKCKGYFCVPNMKLLIQNQENKSHDWDFLGCGIVYSSKAMNFIIQ